VPKDAADVARCYFRDNRAAIRWRGTRPGCENRCGVGGVSHLLPSQIRGRERLFPLGLVFWRREHSRDQDWRPPASERRVGSSDARWRSVLRPPFHHLARCWLGHHLGGRRGRHLRLIQSYVGELDIGRGDERVRSDKRRSRLRRHGARIRWDSPIQSRRAQDERRCNQYDYQSGGRRDPATPSRNSDDPTQNYSSRR
jgi:hypothetical protein